MSLIGIISFIVIGGVICVYSLKADKNTVKLLILLCFFQNIYILILSSRLTDLDYTVLCLLKEILVYVVILFSFIKKRKIDRTEIYSIIALAVLLLYLFARNDFSMSAISSFRQLSIPFVLYMFGRSIRLKKGELRELAQFFIRLCILSVLFGIVQIVVGPAFFDKMGMQNYMLIKYGYVMSYGGYCVPNSMMSYDLYPYTGKMYFRMASVLVDPVILAQILALAYILVAFDRENQLVAKKRQMICAILLAAGTLLTLGKSGIIIIILATVYLWGKKNIQNKLLSYGIYFIGGILCLMIMFRTSTGSSIDLHLRGLTENVRQMAQYPIGRGIGMAGNLAAAYGVDVENSGESFVGAVIAQMGIVGLGIYGLFLWGVSGKYKSIRNKNSIYDNVYIAANCVWITSLVNNTAISFTNCFMYFIVLGFTADSIVIYEGREEMDVSDAGMLVEQR